MRSKRLADGWGRIRLDAPRDRDTSAGSAAAVLGLRTTVCLVEIPPARRVRRDVPSGTSTPPPTWPVRIGMEVAAVVVLFSRRRRAQRQELRDLMSDIVARIGQFLERERAVEGLRALRKAVETIRMGVTITDVRGRILYTNPADAAMHGYQTDG